MDPQKIVTTFLSKLSTVYVGDPVAGEKLFTALLAGCHVLVEDVPGVGKTTLVKAAARLSGLEFKRIQFSPDLLPGDVIGSGTWNPGTMEFQYRPGPIQTQCLLADELNRGSTRTQAAFLEAMQEGQVTVDGKTYPLPEPFWVVATQNPMDFSSTFQLPEAELDRFGISLVLGYPNQDNENRILSSHRTRSLSKTIIQDLVPILSPSEISQLQNMVNQVQVSDSIQNFITLLARQTRNNPALSHGISPRAAIHLMKYSQARALIAGRQWVLIEDIKAAWLPCVSHRLKLSGESRLGGKSLDEVLNKVFVSVPQPGPA